MMRRVAAILSAVALAMGAVAARGAPERPHEAGPATTALLDVGSVVRADEGEDAPGSDEGALARPAGSVRLLSTSLDVRGTTLRVYRAERAIDVVTNDLRGAARSRGLREVVVSDPGTLAFHAEGRFVIARALPAERGTLITLVEAPFVAARGGEP
jgi:hypothetical protein